ncbi:MAG: phage tail tape measure protein, partial [Lactobacillus sp.]|nr:phage tail tape measure protein [Lactobacillus sp.]
AVASGILQAIPKATGAINNMINALINYIASSIGDFLSKGGQIIGSFVDGIVKGKNPIDVFKNFIKDIAGLFGLDTLYEQGSAIISGFFNGLKDKFEDVKDWVGGIGDWIAKHKGPLPYDRRLLIPQGGAIMEGFDEGLQTKFKKVQNNVSSMADRLKNSFSNGLPNLNDALNSKVITVKGTPVQTQEKQSEDTSGMKVYINVEKAELSNDESIEETGNKLAKSIERQTRGRLGGK